MNDRKITPNGPFNCNLADRENTTALHSVLNQGRTDLAKAMLRRQRPLLVRNTQGVSALHRAAQLHDPELLQAFFRRGSDPDQRTAAGKTPLMLALESFRLESQTEEIAKLLLDHSASPNSRDNQGDTALHYALARQLNSVAKLLLRRGADPNAKNQNGVSPADLAQPGSDQELIDLLQTKKRES